MKEDSYVVIQSFMLTDLHLKGNELIVYAVIYGYTQDGSHWFYGTRGHLAEWCGATKGTVSNCLRSLLEKGYIRRREIDRSGYVEVQYQAVRNSSTPLPEIITGADKNYDTPVIKSSSIDNLEDNITDKPNNKGFKPPTLEDVKDYASTANLDIDPEAFWYYWESVGWIRGRTKMKNWKAAARQWEKNQARWKRKDGVNWDAELKELADGL